MVRLEQIGKRWDDGAEPLHDVSLALEPGDFRFLTGASGAGKTTLLNIISLAERPSRGSLRLFDNDAAVLDRSARAALRRRIGIVFQDFRLIDQLSVRDNVALPLRIAGAGEEEIDHHIPELLGWLGIADRIAARPPALSAGERQRVAVARALINEPRLLLADEPTGALDRIAADSLADLLVEINREEGVALLVSTHAMNLAGRMSGALELCDGSLRPTDAAR